MTSGTETMSADEKRALLAQILRARSVRGDTFPLSFAQQRLWFLDRFQPGNAAYNIAASWRLRGPLREEVLARALGEVVRRHEVLRTVFRGDESGPVQVVGPAAPVVLPVDDAAGADEAAIVARARAESLVPFDLEAGPLFRARLLRVAGEDHVLVLSMHHAVGDGWSLGVLLREISQLYAAFAAGEPSPLADLPTQYADHAVWQRNHLRGEVLQAQLDYWTARLAGAPALLELPADRPRPAVQSFRGARETSVVPRALVDRLHALARAEGASLYMVLLAAFQALLGRWSGQDDVVVGSPIAGRTRRETEGLIGLFMNTLALRTDLSGDPSFRDLLGRVREGTLDAFAHQDVPFEKLVEELRPERSLSHSPLYQALFALQNTGENALRLGEVRAEAVSLDLGTAKDDLSIYAAEGENGLGCTLVYNPDLFDAATARRFLDGFAALLASAAADPALRLSELDAMPAAERELVVRTWNDTARDGPRGACIHQMIAEQARRTPDAAALVFRGRTATYAQVEARANALAHRLRAAGVGPETRVGICLSRSADVVVAMLGVMKAGGAYLPLDPAYPAARLAYMLQDSAAPVLVTEPALRGLLPTDGVEVITMDGASVDADPGAPESGVRADNAAYVIYTSGSTGRPKGVQVTHANAASFFAGMDERVGGDQPGTWLAVTRTSFDISVLELLWTLARGYRVVVHPEAASAASAPPRVRVSARPMDFSLFYFAGGGDERAADRYRLLLEGARFADRNGFSAVWTPERHFHAFGGAFPNPSVLGAAVAAVTQRVQVRAGSVVLPLHDPVRVAEEWSVVDNLSNGRAGISFASGWQPNDFVLAPDVFARRKEAMFEGIRTVRELWRGGTLTRANGVGKDTTFRVLPRPVQEELPVWVTAGGTPETFRAAGEIGARMLTHLLGQTVEELAEKIELYREAYRASGAPGDGHVTLMIHTFVGDDEDAVRETVRAPFRAYLATALDLIRPIAEKMGVDLKTASADDMDVLLDHAFERYWRTSALLGTEQSCLAMVERLKQAGVDEAACLIDFVDDADTVLAALPKLDGLRRAANPDPSVSIDEEVDADEEVTIPAQIAAHGVTHLQCTPSLAGALVAAEGASALAPLRRLLLGGEALPAELARELAAVLPGRVVNMYGPTETTVWSATHSVDGTDAVVPIGTPIHDTRVYVLSAHGRPQPVGVPGELFIAGAGVTRGYLGRAALTAERFVPEAFGGQPGARMYRTGDRARFKADGTLEFLGRADFQLKVRGFRIEAGEVEAALRAQPSVADAVVGARADGAGAARLIAWITPVEGMEPDAAGLRTALGADLPGYMVPDAVVVLDAFPLTPNGKLDRAALAAPDSEVSADSYEAPGTETERALARIWGEVLRAERIGIHDSFFALGGHSLMAMRVVARVRQELETELPLRAVFEAPTLAALATRVDERRRDRGADAPIPHVERAGDQPLSFAQQRLWVLDQLEPESPVYNMPAPRRIRGALDVAAMERALGELVRRHAGLRTVFPLTADGPVQRILPAEFTLPVTDLSGRADAWEQALRLAQADAVHVFDLSRGPLFRVHLLRLASDDHVLLMNMHHVVSDGWSMNVLRGDLLALYQAFAGGTASTLADLPITYADYAVWQRGLLEGEGGAQLAYWRERLAGAPALLELPTDRPRPAAQSHRGAWAGATLSPALADALKALGRAEGVTLYMTLLAGIKALMARYAGTDDVVIGTPIAGRGRPELERMVGFFVNSLALRTDLSGDPDFRELLARVRETTLGAYANQDVPFEQVVDALQPVRTLSHAPLFQVMFNLLNFEAAATDAAGLRLESVLRHTEQGAKFDVTFTAHEHAGGIQLDLLYAADLFEASTAERLLAHLTRVLEQVAADAGARLSRLELLGDADRALIVDGWNRTEAPYPADRCIHQLVEVRAALAPLAPAVADGEATLTYRELDERANRVAHALLALGVRPEERVGLCLEPCAGSIVGLLGILKAGAAYVPVDPAAPDERAAFMLDESGARVVLADAANADRAWAAGRTVLRVDGTADDAFAGFSSASPAVRLTPRHLAYVLYTSGSTGRPKGVLVEHGGVCNSAVAFARVYGITPGARVLLFAPLHFDASVLDIFTALATGATLVVAPREALIPGEELIGLLARQRVTHAKFTPSALAATPWVSLPELGTVMTGGETCSAEVVGRWAPGRRFFNGYGPTETSVRVTAIETDDATRPPPIGRATANVRLYVLDDAWRPVPVGVQGELYIGGVGLARGYQGRPDRTAETFVPDPFSALAGARMYRSGDRVRWRADGSIDFVGRVDGQVKIRGFRIELGEIEAVLRRHPDVFDCAVVAREGEPGGIRLVGYVVGAAHPEALRAHLRDSLPEYMVPAAYVRMDALPLNPNGKLDRRALPAPEPVAEGAFVEPSTAAEQRIAAMYAELLGLERVGAGDDFFAVGGHSLLATRLVSRVREAFGIDLPLRAVFEAPTVAALARRAEAARRAVRDSAPILRLAEGAAAPLSFAQERLWFLDRLAPGTTAYHINTAVRLSGALDADALDRALVETVRRHAALRTVFPLVDGRPVQLAGPVPATVLAVDDLSAVDGAEREEAMRARLKDAAGRPFDLAAGPVFRAHLLRMDAADHVLLITLHHAVTDGWGREVLLREVGELYGAFAAGRPSPLPELEIAYADYAAWQRAQLTDEVLAGQIGYWTGRLAGAPPVLELPTDRPRPAAPTFGADRERLTLPRELSDALDALARREGATQYMVLLAAFSLLLARYAGTDDVVVGSPIAGRTRREAEGLVGVFLNMLALRTDLSGDPDFRTLLARVRAATLGAYEHQDVPFERLVDVLQPERSLSHAPVFQAAFFLQNQAQAKLVMPGVDAAPLSAGTSTGKFDLTLGAGDTDEGFTFVLEYATELWDAATARRMLDHLHRLLRAVAADPGVPVGALELMDEDERRLSVEGWNATAAAYPAESIHGMIAEQARRTPDAVALAAAGAEITYAALDARADVLARHLRARGVGSESPVGICLERGIEGVAAMLAVLKAGGAYLPLDPSYPAERLAYMLRDSGARVVITDEARRGILPLDGIDVVSMDGDAARIAATDPAIPYSLFPIPSTHGLAYLIYTSGSTGRPKGVQVSHDNVRSFFAGMDARVGTEAGTWLAVTRTSFDISVLELLWTLARGFRVVVHPEAGGAASDGEGSVPAQVARHGVTHLQCTPSLAGALVAEHGAAAFESIQCLMLGGEAMPPALARELLAVLPGRLLNMYGPTETTVWSTTHAVGAADVDGAGVPVGSPIANARVYVVDANLRPAPVGVPGELVIGGPGVARGYRGHPALTAERFVPDAFSATPGARMYRTGDRARRKADGTLEVLGRMDFQVKVRGHRIEPGEIEAALREHASVAEAAVVARPAAGGALRLVAYAVGRDGVPVDQTALRAHLEARLPGYMVPDAYVAMDALPRTPNGKLDRRALPAPRVDEDAFVAPRTPTEEVVAGVWADVLGLERVGALDGFWELGGHSLLATRVMSRVEAALGVRLSLRALFEAPTVAGLAARVDAARTEDTAAALPDIVPVDRDRPLPLSFSQQRLWFLHRMEPDSPFYNMPYALGLSGPIDVAAMEAGIGALLRRHESLRTVFRAGDDGPVQVVAPAAPFRLEIDDLSALPADEREAEARRRTVHDAERPFDLGAGPVFRARLLRLAPDEHVLLMAVHHIVSDAWSRDLLLRELGEMYQAAVEGRAPALAPLAVQYPDYAVWQREHLAGEVMERQLEWWRARLDGAPAFIALPPDRPRPAVQSYRGGRVRAVVPAKIAEGVRALARREGATEHMVLLAAFQALLAKSAGQDDVVVGSPISGRTRRETEGLIGFFVNTLAHRADLSGDPSFRAHLARVREGVLGAYAAQDVPFERLVEALAPERTLDRSPLFNVMFTWQPPQERMDLAGLRARPVVSATAKFDVTLYTAPLDGGLVCHWEYGTDLFHAATIERMARRFAALLSAVAADPDRPLSSVELDGPAERQRVRVAWNDTATEYPREGSIPALFAARAAETPHATALASEAGAMTYARLEARAAQVARRLQSIGIVPGQRVGLAVERSPDAVAAILGILHAGASYVPLDLGYPAGRLAFMLQDSAVAALVVDDEVPEAVAAFAGPVLALASVPADGWHDVHDEVDVPAQAEAYVMYTSGSTGRPKGVSVPHRAVLRLVRDSTFADFGPEHTSLLLAPLAFDASTLELWGPLLNGGRLAVAPAHAPTLTELGSLIRGHGVTTLWLTAGLFHAMVDEQIDALGTLRQLLAGGDALSPGHCARVLERWPALRLINGYGPTENTTFTCCHTVRMEDTERAGIPLGTPVSNTRVYVVDEQLRAVPAGVPGELCAAGDGLAHGYSGRAALTAERFVPDPFSGVPGGRMYRTGDRVRWLADGTVEFLGRLDQQAKIRGYRIEPGEVAAVLEAHASVAQAVAEVREDRPGEKRLVAYIVPARPEAGEQPVEEGQAAQVGSWESLFDDLYAGTRGTEEGDETFDIIGWNSSYTGEPIPADEMREWVDATVARIHGLSPSRILEIGCGTGLLLFRVVPGAQAYLGTDLSARVLDTLRERVERERARGAVTAPVRLLHREAVEFEGIDPRAFDVAILNSVGQYFPSAAYLARVVAETAGALADGGAFFLGDIRNRSTLEAFRAAAELGRAPDALSVRELRERVRRMVVEEEELVVDPEIFAALAAVTPRVARAEVRLKRGLHHNELTRHRFDAVLRVGPVPALADAESVEWTGGSADSVDAIRATVESRGGPVAVLRIPNARVAGEFRAAELLLRGEEGAVPPTAAGLRDLLAAEPVEAVDPEALWILGESLGLEVDVRPTPGEPACFDALFRAPGVAAGFPSSTGSHPSVPLRALANDPLWARHARTLVPLLREHLREQLPEYMNPGALVLLDALPLTPNGKVDRRALPAPEVTATGEYVAPRTPAEEVLAGIWMELLGVERVGTEDDFFALGGHSLLATQVISRIREVFHVELPLRGFFEAPTVAGLAAAVARMATEDGGAGDPDIVPVPRDRALPLSFAQERLWFIDQLEPGKALYVIPSTVRLKGSLDAGALVRAVGAIVERHESLRTRFPLAGSRPVQHVASADGFRVETEDLSQLPADEREAAMAARVGQEAGRAFDLAAGPLFRARLLRLDDRDHALVMVTHHSVSDGWSLGVLYRELSALYAAFARGEPSPLAPLPVQYADYTVWQRATLSGDALDRQLAWWRRSLAGAPALLELPTDHPRPLVQSFRGARIRALLAPELLEQLRALARREGATLYMVLLAAWQATLGRYAGTEDVVVGSPIAGRTRRETEGLIGFFVNTLALRGDLSGDPSFRRLLARVRETTLGAFANQDIPFDRLVEELVPERTLSHSPVFQVMFALQNVPPAAPAFPGLEASGVGSGTSVSPFELALNCTESRRGLLLAADYNPDLYEGASIDRMLAQWEALLRAAVEAPGARLSELAALPPAERRLVLEDWNRTAAAFPAAHVHALFAAQAARTPGAIAVVDSDGGTVTYAALDAESSRLARALRGLGVGAESRVGVCMDRPGRAVLAILAILKAGGAYVPLDPELPAARMADIAADSGLRVVVTVDGLADGLPADVRRLRLDGDAASIAAEPADAVDVEVPDEALAYVIYTSGSTGRPKGVMVTRGAVASFTHAMVRSHGFESRHRILVLPPLSFDASVGDLFPALAVGAALVFHADPAALTGAALLRFCAEHGVTTVDAAAALFKRWVDDCAAMEGPVDFGTLEMVMMGGESVDTGRVRAWGRMTDGRVQLVNHYGPTEATVCTTVHVTDGAVDEGAPAHLPIGRPLANTRVYVLDGHLRPVPLGAFGELCVGGAGVARGYQNRPAQAAEAFVPDPFDAKGGARMYRTGDRARWLPDGTLEFAGRNDHQVKIRGYRVELGEIEAVLREHHAVDEALVMVRERVPGDRRLVAYVVPPAGAAPTSDELRGHLGARLPDYMVPSAWTTLIALPLTPNGKVDRRALPEPEYDVTEREHVAPRTPLERVVAEVWQELLGAPRVGAEDDFFALGGHSLLATQVTARLQQVFQVEVPLKHVLGSPTVAGLAAAMEADASMGPRVRRIAELLVMVSESDEEDEPAGALAG
jgi:natural product biosynthesis luciferase-like monooxygenase protein/amino acid adenylation domain-containing protein